MTKRRLKRFFNLFVLSIYLFSYSSRSSPCFLCSCPLFCCYLLVPFFKCRQSSSSAAFLFLFMLLLGLIYRLRPEFWRQLSAKPIISEMEIMAVLLCKSLKTFTWVFLSAPCPRGAAKAAEGFPSGSRWSCDRAGGESIIREAGAREHSGFIPTSPFEILPQVA